MIVVGFGFVVIDMFVVMWCNCKYICMIKCEICDENKNFEGDLFIC